MSIFIYFCNLILVIVNHLLMIRFTKMHGAGNDYIYINCIDHCIEAPEKLAIEMSDRHYGAGSDGLVLILPSTTCDFRMRMFNPDGSEAEMCGNASRCVGKYVYDKRLTDKKEITLETNAGIKRLSLFVSDGYVKSVKVDMGEPVLNGKDIPVDCDSEKIISYPIEVNEKKINVTCVSMGNPHAVIFCNEITDEDINVTGRLIEKHPFFPKKTNVEFCKINDRNNITMRVWERGTGETLACGTGACASLVAAVLNGLADRKATLHLSGGDLQIEWGNDNHIYMTGPAVTVYEGEWSNT